jgi:hypothetical protein
MDPRSFDSLVKSLSTCSTRRNIARLLASLPLGVLLSALVSETPETHAKDDDHGSSHRQHRRKAKHRHQTGNNKEHRRGKRKGKDKGTGTTSCAPTTCAAQGKNCGTIADDCGGQLRCGPDSCGAGFSCTENVCRCPDGTAVCEGICCQDGEVCQNGTGPCCTAQGQTAACAGQECVGSATDSCTGEVYTCPGCAGCCAGTTCVAVTSQSRGQCGTSTPGAACGSCATCQTCSGGQCQGDAADCSTGCCSGTTCHPGNVPTLCGHVGGTCFDCNSVFACSGNRCQCAVTSGCCVSPGIRPNTCNGCCSGGCNEVGDPSSGCAP